MLQWKALSFMLLGIGIGFWIGLLPGLGGGVTLSLMLAFIYGMKPVEAFAFLIGMHSVTATTGDITSILFGVPGEGISAATILDGHAMAKKGEAGRAIGAALMSSLVGAVVGAAALALSIPILRPLVFLFGAPELFMFAVLGISCIASLIGRGYHSQLRGLAAGALGLLLSTVGLDPSVGQLRYDFGFLFLWDGIGLVPVVVGVFAVPEIVDLAVRRTAIAGPAATGKLSGGVWEGVKDTFRHFGVTFRSCLIGLWVGILPGIGAGAGQWIAYAHAIQSAPLEERDRFGKGDVRGVLAPGALNNAKEGGDLIPTLAFGVPGSTGMAILLGAFMIQGLVPGPDMLTKHLDVTFSMVWTIVIANTITVLICLGFMDYLARITMVRGTLLIPFLVLLVFIGSYASSNEPANLVVTIVFGALGYLMLRFNWPRPPMVLGFILGRMAETYLNISIARYEMDWIFRPLVIIQFLLIVFVIAYPYLQDWWVRRSATGQSVAAK
ncbi:MAG: tripartite tricarboxylate transporter permease [Deltaproteobacteria bacterium]|nr:tripartite tricarboxylate transporter permease [Deltaproteobacteria bacterium]